MARHGKPPVHGAHPGIDAAKGRAVSVLSALTATLGALALVAGAAIWVLRR